MKKILVDLVEKKQKNLNLAASNQDSHKVESLEVVRDSFTLKANEVMEECMQNRVVTETPRSNSLKDADLVVHSLRKPHSQLINTLKQNFAETHFN